MEIYPLFIVLLCFLAGGGFSLLSIATTEFDSGTLTLSSLKLLGDAHLGNNKIKLTRDLAVPNSGAGKVLYSKPVRFRRPDLDFPASFSTFFSFSVTNLNPSSIGGGLAFVITPDDESVGDAGGYMGIMNAKGGQNGNFNFAVEFDTLMDVEFKDINGNHVGLDLNSMVSTQVGDLDSVGVDLKSGNLVNSWIDYSGFNARLGDFGLARQIEHDKSPDATVAAGTMGYLAPEYLLTGRATEKTDVFSYGAVVLEVASGRRPIEKEKPTSGVGGLNSNLVEWVWGLHKDGNLLLAADSRLNLEFDEQEMTRVLLIGLICSHPDPMYRPTMRGVVQMLVGEAEVPIVPRAKPSMSFSTSHLLMTLQDSVSDLNGMITLSTSSSENSFNGVDGHGGMDLV